MPGRLLPGIIYEMTTAGPTPLGPSLGGVAVPAPVALPEVERRRSDLSRFGLAPGVEPVPGYHLVARIGEGRSGEVWKACGPGGFPLAMKLMDLGTEEARDQFRSMSLMKDVRHDNLLTIFGVWQLDGLLVVGMELADGSLLDHLGEVVVATREGLPFGELVDFLGQAARGLDFLNQPPVDRTGHARAGLLHRAAKPGNMLLVGGRVKLGDFGRVASLEEPAGARDDEDLRSIDMPPEWSEGRLDRRSDQYALAMAYCRLRTGRLPIAAGPRPGGRPSPRVEPDLTILLGPERSAVARALARNPEDRWPDCLTFVRELGRAGTTSVVDGDRTRPGRHGLEGLAKGYRGRRPLVAAASLSSLAIAVLYATHRGDAGRVAQEPPAVVDAPHAPARPDDRPAVDSGDILEELPDVELVQAPPRPDDRPAVEAIRAGEAGPDLAAGRPVPPPEEDVAVAPLAAPKGVRFRRVFAALQDGIATLRRASVPAWRAADPAQSPAMDRGGDVATRSEVPPIAEAGQAAGPGATGPPGSPKAIEPAGPPKADRSTIPVVASKEEAKGRAEPDEPDEEDRPRPATITVLLPTAAAELIVRGEVGRGNPDEWYGPKRVIHSPPIGETKDYLVGSFWTDQAKGPQTRSKELKVKPGRTYEVDLRTAEPTAKEVRQSSPSQEPTFRKSP